MNQAYIDLNLLSALDALLEEGSVSGAAARLHVTQPAMSRTLARLREATGDAILVRSGRAMIATAHARSLRSQVASLVQGARAVLSAPRELKLHDLERAFTLRCHDALVPGLSSALLQRLSSIAPGVSLRFVGESSSDGDDLRQGRVDLDIGSSRGSGRGVREEQLGQDVLAVVLRRDHPAARGKLTPKRYAEARHAVVSRRGRLRDAIDQALQARGLERRAVVATPTVATALCLVQDCGLVTTVARGACAPLVRSFGLVWKELPLTTPPIPIVQSWPEHLDGDLAHRWLREQTRAALERLTGSSPRSNASLRSRGH